jgi:probable HAF family extracellular repeat protein
MDEEILIEINSGVEVVSLRDIPPDFPFLQIAHPVGFPDDIALGAYESVCAKIVLYGAEFGYEEDITDEAWSIFGKAVKWILESEIPEPEAPCMVLIPSGVFEMGDHHDQMSDSLPVHEVYVESFYMGCYEITNQQYCDYLNSAMSKGQLKVVGGEVFSSSDSSNSYTLCDTHSYDPESQIDYSGGVFSVRIKDGHDMANHPIVEVPWYGAAAYCNWRSQQEGYQDCYDLSTWECDFSKNGYRLPTEAEWEYAARGGGYTPYYRYSWGDNIDGSKANYRSSGDPYDGGAYPWTTPVGYYNGSQIPSGTDMANGYGLYDMTGNVWEWCNDWYGPYEICEPNLCNNPRGPDSGTYRILRGGSWFCVPQHCRVAYRNQYIHLNVYPGSRGCFIGFRIARCSKPPEGKIVFSREGDIYIMEPDGSNVMNITNTPNFRELEPTWSPDGSHIAFACSSGSAGNWERPDIWIMNPDGSGRINLTQTTDTHEEYPTWSPDGLRIAYVWSIGEVALIYVMNSDGTDQSPLTSGPADSTPSWSPDGMRILFSRDLTWPDSPSNHQIFVMKADGTSVQRLTWNNACEYYPSWSPDGSKIVFHSNRNGNLWRDQIFVGDFIIDANGEPELLNQTNITNNSYRNAFPRWSPDGSCIVFQRASYGSPLFDIWVMDADGANAIQLTNTPGIADVYPDWGIPKPPCEASFQGLGDLPGGNFYSKALDVSSDGSVVVGFSTSSLAQKEAFRWTSSEGMQPLGDLPGGGFESMAVAISADGSVIIGWGKSSTSAEEAFRWTQETGMVGLGQLPGQPHSSSVGVSTDGSQVVGYSHTIGVGWGTRAFLWTLTNPGTGEGTMEPLEDLPSNGIYSNGYGFSADGSTIVGHHGNRGVGGSGIEASYWRKDSGGQYRVHGLGMCGVSYASSYDGSIIVGYMLGGPGVEAFRWTEETGVVGLGDLAGGSFNSLADDITPDGSVVVGYSNSSSGDEAFVWDEHHGMRNLKEVLVSYGLDLTSWTLRSAHGISDDGLSIVGLGINPDGNTEGWIVRLCEPVTTNTAPIADAGDDQEVSTGPDGTVEFILDCSGSEDPDGDELTYTWLMDGEEIATGVNPTIVLPCGTYIIELIVNDGMVDSEPDYVEITVLDGTPPVISCPGNVTLECPDDTSPENTGSATATDNCDDDPAITYSDVLSGACLQVIERTWTATDTSGNSSSCEQTITVQDTTPPVIICPPDVTLECPADTSPGATGSATGSDTCGSVTITHSDVSVPGCGNTEVIIRTWTATDECGNSSNCVQTIEVVDTTPPVITCPADVTLECPADTTPDATGEATATDACGDVTITHSDVSVPGCGSTETITRTWTATDECGNSSNCVQTINVVDTTAPEVTVIIPQAGSALQDGVTLMAEASDTCGDVVEVYFYIRELDDANGIPIGQEDLAANLNAVSGKWEYAFDTTELLDGYYVILGKAVDSCGNEGWTEVVVKFSIRNWAVIELLPASESNKAGRTMPVKFSLRIAESVDPAMPFVYNEGLEIKIYDAADLGTILQTSVYGEGAKEYRIESIEELYITNFKTKKNPAKYVVEIWRPSKNFLVGSFGFETVK